MILPDPMAARELGTEPIRRVALSGAVTAPPHRNRKAVSWVRFILRVLGAMGIAGAFLAALGWWACQARAQDMDDLWGMMTMLQAPQPVEGILAELDFAARVDYWEARSTDARCQALVIAVALNDLEANGGDIAKTTKLFDGLKDHIHDRTADDTAWRRAQNIAVAVYPNRGRWLMGELVAFHDSSVTPNWTDRVQVATCSPFMFYRRKDRP